MALFSSLFGGTNDKAIAQHNTTVDRINALEEEMAGLSGAGLKERSSELKEELAGGATLDDILSEAFALVRETAKRNLGQRAYDTQVLGGITLHQGRIAQMRTGEGKTLAATLPTYLNALSGNGVHVVTVNDYLARRDAVWMGQVYYALGLSIGVITHDSAYLYDPAHVIEEGGESENKADEERDETGSFRVEQSYLRPVARREAYAADITYGTNNEFGFDYLRDNLVQEKEAKVQRGFHYAIVDEVDSILIDEARTPLIISAPDTESSDLYTTFAGIVPQLKEEEDYTVNEKLRSVVITQHGLEKVERTLGIDNLYDETGGGGVRHAHALEQALRAAVMFTRDKDYVVREGEVIIVDEFTGRLMPGRRYSDGLHQAIEAKEGVAIQRESRTVASITFQNYFRMYEKLSGMTGTAITNAEEFDKVYKLPVVLIPTNKPLVREDLPDLVFATEEGKFKAVIEEVKRRNGTGQPVLIGTTSIERNEYLSALLGKTGIKHELLNAKNHEREAEIIAQAGRRGAVTVATNMAGRGVDIILGGNPSNPDEAAAVRAAGGLFIMGTERHEARRIDDQLRGRAGRQGDPGASQFFLSLEDKMLRVFGGDRVQRLMKTLRIPEDQPIESKMISGVIENAQSKIEGMNFDTRKHLLDYDEVLNKQRTSMYRRRDLVLESSVEDLVALANGYLEEHIRGLVAAYTTGEAAREWDMEALQKELAALMPVQLGIVSEGEKILEAETDLEEARERFENWVVEQVMAALKTRQQELGDAMFATAVRWLMLRTIDTLWMDHLDEMEYLRDSVRLRAYAQRDPLVEYKNEGSRMFSDLEAAITATVASSLFKVQIHEAPQAHQHLHAQHKGGEGEAVPAVVAGPKEPGRNDPCPCGSGLKWKKCGMINAPEHKG